MDPDGTIFIILLFTDDSKRNVILVVLASLLFSNTEVF